jgi:hypothetical protein
MIRLFKEQTIEDLAHDIKAQDQVIAL